jgi:stage IV sporulation protein FB
MNVALPGGRITIRFSPSFWLMIAIYGGAAGDGSLRRSAIWGGVIGFSILWHEMGHALTSVAFGSGADIGLHGFGGETRSRREKPVKTWQSVLISANGCLAGLGLAAAAVGAAFFFKGRGADVAWAADWLPAIIWANVYLSLLNLLPVQPLDGGHLLALILQARFGRRGLSAAHGVGAVAAALVAGAFYFIGQPFMAAVAAFMAAGEYRGLRRVMAYNPQDEDVGLRGEFKAARETWERGEKDAAIAALTGLRGRLRPGLLLTAATKQLAHHLYDLERIEAAYPLLRSVPDGELSPADRLLLQYLAHRAGDFAEAVRLGQNNFQGDPDARTAAAIAASYAVLGDARRAVQWLGTAARRGLNADLSSADFDKIRDEPDFREFENSRKS